MKRLVVMAIIAVITVWGILSLKNAAEEFGQSIANNMVVSEIK